jgi:prevent-host-death family protein
MKQYNIHDTKTNLSKILQMVEEGEEIIISRNGDPVAVLKPYPANNTVRKGGQWKNKMQIAADFDEFGPDLQDVFNLNS